jgi:hypothetical protein
MFLDFFVGCVSLAPGRAHNCLLQGDIGLETPYVLSLWFRPPSDGNVVGTSGVVENYVFVYFLVYLDLRLMLDFGEDWAGLLRVRDGVGSAFLLFKDGLSYMLKFIRGVGLGIWLGCLGL